MQNIHPYRRRAYLYIAAPVLLLAVCLATGLGANSFDQHSRTYHALSTMAGIGLLLLFIYIAPFSIYAVRYWRMKIEPTTLPPADDQPHSVEVQFSDNLLAKIFSMVIRKRAMLSWVNSSKTIKLVRGEGESAQTIFEVPYSSIQKFVAEFNMATIKVNGKSYMCTPFSIALAISTVTGMAAANQLPTILLGAARFRDAGMPELIERLRAEGVEVVTVNVKRSVELSVIGSFVLLFVGAIFVSGVLVR